MTIPCTSDPCQEAAMRKILEAAAVERTRHMYADHMHGLMNDEQTQKAKRFGKESEDGEHDGAR